MKKSFKFTAKKVEQAISDGLSALGVQMDEVEVNIISSGGFFKKAEVELVITVPDPVEEKPTPVKQDVSKTQTPINKKEEKRLEQPAHQEKQAQNNNQQRPVDKQKPVQNNSQKPQHNHNKPQSQKLFANNPKRDEVPNNNASQAKPAFAAKFNQQSGEGFTLESGMSLASLGNNNTRPPSDKPNVSKLFAKNPPRHDKPKFTPRERKNDRVPATEENKEVAVGFIEKMFELGGFDGKVSANIEDALMINIETENAAIIGHRGEALDALQYLTSLIINGGKDKFVVVGMDALGYKEKRKETLRRLAQKMADKCLKNNRRMGLEPMNSQDRKEIHAYLSEIEGVITRSEGHEPNRRIVVYPERRK